MRKFWQVIVCAVLVVTAVFSSFACSNTPKTSQSSINLQQMANDVDNLKTSFAVLNTAFTNLKIGDSVSVSSFDTLKGDFILLKAKVDLIETPKQEVTQAELDILAAQVSAISTSINSLTTQLTALDNELSVVQSDVASLKTSVAALQTVATTTPPATTPSVSLVVSLTAVSPVMPEITLSDAGVQKLTYLYAFTYTNPTNTTISNVKFNLAFVANGATATKINSVTLAAMGVTTPIWVSTLPPGTLYNFNNWPALSINGNQTVNLLLALTVELKSVAAIGDLYYFYPQANVAS